MDRTIDSTSQGVGLCVGLYSPKCIYLSCHNYYLRENDGHSFKGHNNYQKAGPHIWAYVSILNAESYKCQPFLA